jgi:hypothetical protein
MGNFYNNSIFSFNKKNIFVNYISIIRLTHLIKYLKYKIKIAQDFSYHSHKKIKKKLFLKYFIYNFTQ